MQLYNTLTRRKEEFVPREPGQVAMYVCGPTTYNYIHLGNARPLVFFDTVRRYFEYRGYRVLYVQNFTDIDDKIINRAREEKADALLLAQKYVAEYFKDADALNVRRADIHPRVSGHLPEITAMIAALLEKGAAYVVDGDVYFHIASFPAYGRLSGRSLDEMQAGARVEVDPRKKHPMDFALWKAAKPGEPAWDSPWGKGRPGWHIECSAMAVKYLGHNFDIHGGGFDLIFPHHENEIAQAEAATGRPFARYWMHNGFITVNQEKMSKSLGNFFLVREILEKFPPPVVRFFLLSTHYRSPLDFDDEKLAAAGRGLERIKTSIRLLAEAMGRGSGSEKPPAAGDDFPATLEKYRQDFIAAMDDDFNTALAIGIFFELAREVNTYLQDGSKGGGLRQDDLAKAMSLFFDFNRVLGLFPVDVTAGRIRLEEPAGDDDKLTAGLIALLLEVRGQARARKDWAAADRIRDGLKELGIILEDTPQGVRWKRQQG
ncbi:cysteine--tRNA ligase [Desulfotomaculum copahuensis]|uniref:Cysteine--tRNA ligase n=1 Tax=Desulfotomaculum copahuensis TaxID=1838280 RepID=A0A1B7LGS2_9FIRM|nr:cysteine--tRNA ligase [Desulfotomaculum copahuensis]OAT85301.1 cysteine--tRNA ligase [Desulfotomaculum copahuensis]